MPAQRAGERDGGCFFPANGGGHVIDIPTLDSHSAAVFKRFLPHKQDADESSEPASAGESPGYDEAPVEEQKPAPAEEAVESTPPAGQSEKAVKAPTSTTPAPSNMPESVSKNILSSDVKITGSIEFEEELFFDGQLEGEIHSEGSLTVGENAQIRGDIFTKAVTVLGKVTGNITVQERCELKSRAQLIGDLQAARLTIEEGAIFEGRSEVNPTKNFAAGRSSKSSGGGGTPSGGGSSASSGSNPGGGNKPGGNPQLSGAKS